MRRGRGARVAGILLAGLVCVGMWKLLERAGGGDGRSATPTAASIAAERSIASGAAAAQAHESEARSTDPLARDPAGARTLDLALVRFPDEEPLADVPLEIEPRLESVAGAWLATSDEGRVRVEVPGDARSVGVRAEGFEPLEAALGPERTVSLVLTPSSGLFGRVLRPDGTPAAAAQVQVQFEERTLQFPGGATRSHPVAHSFLRNRVVAGATTSERGFYYLACATRTASASARVRATSSDGLAGSLAVTLPREPSLLGDLTLAEPEKLVVRVIDPDGRPIAGAWVESDENPQPKERSITGPEGLVIFPSPNLPASLRASAEGRWLRERRFDGDLVDRRTRVESCRTRVALVLGPAPMARVRFVDAETRFPIWLAHGRATLRRNGEPAGESEFEPDKNGEARVLFFDPQRGPGTGDLPDLARLSVSKEGYRRDQVFELDPRAPPSPEPTVFALEPVPGYACLRGRAVREGEPVADLQVGLKVQLVSDGATPGSWQYARTFTDGQGRFALRWKRDAAEQVVTVYPHQGKEDEFAFLGPMSEREAVAREHLLEILPAVRVPAVLRGVEREGRYCYYVSVLAGGVAVGTTVNGVPIPVHRDGEARATLLLPSQRRCRITVGYRTGSAVMPDCSTPAEYDPARPVLPLVFEVRPIFADLRGRVAGFAADEIRHLAIGLVLAGEDQSRLVRPEPDGSFLLARVSRGKGDLFLVQEGADPGGPRVLGRQHVVIDGDLEGLVLAADPGSLPEAPDRRGR
ncbi:MAG: hypothetical protein L0323_00655 [Planctomycetes bacterium]|nr:hypothetical protein [Planctomycetota bacterium]